MRTFTLDQAFKEVWNDVSEILQLIEIVDIY